MLAYHLPKSNCFSKNTDTRNVVTKTLRKKRGINIHDLRLSNNYLNMTPTMPGNKRKKKNHR